MKKTFLKFFLNALFTTALSILIRYCLLKYNIDIFNVVNNTTSSFIAFFGLNFIRLVIRNLLEEFIPDKCFMNLPEGPSGSGGSGSSGSSSNQSAEGFNRDTGSSNSQDLALPSEATMRNMHATLALLAEKESYPTLHKAFLKAERVCNEEHYKELRSEIDKIIQKDRILKKNIRPIGTTNYTNIFTQPNSRIMRILRGEVNIR